MGSQWESFWRLVFMISSTGPPTPLRMEHVRAVTFMDLLGVP